MTTRRGSCDPDIRVDLLVPSVGKCFVRWHFVVLARIVFLVERYTLCFEPFEVRDTIAAIRSDLCLIRARRHSHQIRDHILHGVIEAVGFLYPCAPSAVDVPTGSRC